MSIVSTTRIPARSLQRFRELKADGDSLSAASPPTPVDCPIFGNGPRPAPAPLPPDMPPQLAKEVHGLRAELAVKTPQEIIAELRNSGVSIAGWARANGFQREIVAQVLAGKLKGVHGEAHAVAVALGMKQGRPRQAADIRFTEAD